MKRNLRICYFAPVQDIHTKRWLDYFSQIGHEIFLYGGHNSGFHRWPFINQKDSQFNEKLTLQPTFKNSRIQALISRTKTAYKAVFSQNQMVLMLRSFKYVRKHTSKIKPDLVHTLWLGYGAYHALLTGVRPRLITIWGSDIRYLDTLPRLKQWQLLKALRTADAVTGFGSSELLRLCEAKGMLSKHCYDIGAPGIDINMFKSPKSNRLKNALHFPNETQVIVSPRAMRPLYRIDEIVKSFEHVHSEMPKTVLLILNYNADPEYQKHIQLLVQQSIYKDAIIFLEKVPYDQMPELYAMSSVMVSLPRSDGMPQTLLEALAAGCPVITEDLSTYNGLIENYNTGLRVSGDNREEIVHAVLSILRDENLRQRLVNKGRTVVQKKGDMHKEMRKMEHLYYDLLSMRNR